MIIADVGLNGACAPFGAICQAA